MNIYGELDYRRIIAETIRARKATASEFTFQRAADAARVHKAYLSRVLAGKAEFNTDQLYLLAEYLGYSDDERRYLALLLEYARTGIEARRASLRREIHAIQSARIDPKSVMRAPNAGTDLAGVGEYYLDPIYQLVHIAVSIPRYAANLTLLAKDTGQPPARIVGAVERLERLRIVERVRGRVKILVDDLHLPRNSPLYRAYRTQVRLASIQKLGVADEAAAFTYATTFSADLATRAKIQARFLEFLAEFQDLVKPAPCEEAFQMNFDLFTWTKE